MKQKEHCDHQALMELATVIKKKVMFWRHDLTATGECCEKGGL